MTRQSIVFGCDETYFFRGSAPFTAGENAFLASLFPPNPGVFQGVIRTALMNAHGTDYDDYYRGRCNVCATSLDGCPVLSRVGPAGQYDEMGLDFFAPFVLRWDHANGGAERLYPAPFDVLVEGTDPTQFVRLRPSKRPIYTDLGPVALPAAPTDRAKEGGNNEVPPLKPIDGGWMAQSGLERYLQGRELRDNDIVTVDKIVLKERRAGVGRDRATRGVRQGLLYFLEHLRFEANYGLGVDVAGLPDAPLSPAVKLGGEGRLSSLQRLTLPDVSADGLAASIDAAPRFAGLKTFKLVLLSPTRFSSGEPLPEGFTKDSLQGFAVQRGVLNGINATFITMTNERAVRIGGWDMQKGVAKPQRAYLPAGTVMYFATEHPGDEVVDALHNKKIGLDIKIGHGHVLVGRW